MLSTFRFRFYVVLIYSLMFIFFRRTVSVSLTSSVISKEGNDHLSVVLATVVISDQWSHSQISCSDFVINLAVILPTFYLYLFYF